ncbi:MAG: alpha/beta fold hydrolase [Alphaproteobacteria bacterium]|nr:alpha/beta fold hydrolase [Alphaproteobacteria bacterium]
MAKETADKPTPRKTIVALHGAGVTGAVWGGIVPHLLDFSFRALTFPGHDPRVEGEPLQDISGMAGWVREKITDSAPGSVVLLGHSMGALVALEAASSPAVGGIALLGAGAKMPVNEALLTAARDNPTEAAGMIAKWGVDAAHPQAGAVRTVLSGFMAGTSPAAVGADLAACNGYENGEAAAKAVKCPALILAGAHDKMVPAKASAALAELMEQGDLRVLADCGHMAMLERPLEAANEIKPFVMGLL